MYVINLVLTEEDVLDIGIELMSAIAVLDTSSVMRQIKMYISNKNANPEVVSIIKQAYASNLLVFYTSTDEALSEAILVAGRIKLNTISYNMTIGELENILKSIELIHKYDDVMKPYRAPVNVRAYNDVYQLLEDSGFSKIAKKLRAYKSVFTDRVNSKSVGTDFKRVSFNMPNIDIAEYGITFLTEMKKNGVTPAAWRHL